MDPKTLINTALAFIGHRFDLLTDAIQKGFHNVRVEIDAAKVGAAVAEAINKGASIKHDTSSLEQALKNAADAYSTSDGETGASLLAIAKQLSTQNDPTNEHLSNIHGRLSDLLDSQRATPELIMAALREVASALEALKTINLPEMTIKRLETAAMQGRGSTVTSIPGPRFATRVTVANVTMASAAAEYSYKLPANTVGFVFKLRDQGTLCYYNFVSGKLPGSGDSSAYLTVPQNFLRSPENVEWDNKTIYFTAESDSQVAEIEVHTL